VTGAAPGTVALVGGSEWREKCSFDAELLDAAASDEVLVLPTAAAYEHPERAVETATRHFSGLGARVRGLMVLRRPDAEDPEAVQAMRRARFVYIGGGSPLHLRSVLKDSALWQALLEAWHGGAVVAASSAGAMVLTDPMVDPRGGAFTLGLGLIEQLAIVPHYDTWSHEKTHRTVQLAPAGIPVVGIDEQTALLRDPEGGWRVSGAGTVNVFLDRCPADLAALPG